MATPVETPPQPDAGARECPRCGSAVGAYQEYCLECGARLPADPSAAPPAPAAGWVWPVLVTAVVALLAAGVVVTVQLVHDDPVPELLADATTAQPTLPPTTAEPPPTETLPALTEPPTVETQTQPPPPPPPPPNRVVPWPTGKRGWTVVLESVPIDAGRATATGTAKEAAQAGLPEVGVLRSAAFSSLHPGYFVVFSGIHDTRAQAERGLSGARERGYDGYVRPIVP